MKNNNRSLYKGLSLAAFLTFGFDGRGRGQDACVFGDNMVMQQNTDANMWGTAKASSTVTVTPGWTSEVYKTKAGKRWKMENLYPDPCGRRALHCHCQRRHSTDAQQCDAWRSVALFRTEQHGDADERI